MLQSSWLVASPCSHTSPGEVTQVQWESMDFDEEYPHFPPFMPLEEAARRCAARQLDDSDHCTAAQWGTPGFVHPIFHAQCPLSCCGTEILLGVVFQLAAWAAARPSPSQAKRVRDGTWAAGSTFGLQGSSPLRFLRAHPLPL